MQSQDKKKIVLLGGTGSIGSSTLDVIRANSESYSLWAITANNSVKKAVDIAKEFTPKYLCFSESSRASLAKELIGESKVEILCGEEDLCKLASDSAVDIVVSAIVGSAALKPTLSGVKAGHRIALANKESLVMAGALFNRLAKENNAEIIPVDSEHSAIFSCLFGEKPRSISSITLTASGGPFRNRPLDTFDTITPSEALNHPTWDMGAKITIDSATMFNKALEIIEAHYLFGIPYEAIKVLVHPQSIVHGMVCFDDESTLAQLSVPDMKLPIQLAMSWPERKKSPCVPMDLSKISPLEFFPVDNKKFPSIQIGYNAGKRGGTATTALNAANEIAVARFLQKDIQFSTMFSIVSKVVEEAPHYPADTLEEILSVDARARDMASRISK